MHFKDINLSQLYGKLSSSLFLSILIALSLYLVIKVNKLDSMFYVFIDHWQYGDFTYTTLNPFKALFYLHAQPPLLNAILFVSALISKSKFYDVFIAINCFCSSITAIIIYRICKRYTSTALSALLSFGYLLSPAVLLYASYPFYPTLTALGYALLAYSFYLISENRNRAIYLFILALFYLTTLRSSFTYLHGVFFLFLFLIQIYFQARRKEIYLLFVGSLFALFLLPTKNYLTYNFFGTSSWAPQNLALGFGVHVPPKVFPSPQEIRDAYPELRCRYSYAWIDSTDLIKTNQINYNSCYVLEFSRKHLPIILRDYDFTTHKNLIKENIQSYLRPSYNYFVLSAYNRDKLKSLRQLYKNLGLTARVGGHDVRAIIIVATILVTLLALKQRDALLGSLLTILLLHFSTSVLTDGKESDRFVFDVEFLFYIFIAIVLAQLGTLTMKFMRYISERASN